MFQIKKTELGRFMISTVHLPVDHGWDGKPKWFETIIFEMDPEGKVDFSGDLSNNESYCGRCETKEEAFVQHEDAIRWLKDQKLV